MPNAAARNGLLERHARGKMEKRWKNTALASNTNDTSGKSEQGAPKTEEQPDTLDRTPSTESSKSRWRSRKFHVPTVSSTESQETDEPSPRTSRKEAPSQPTTFADAGSRYSRHRLRPTETRQGNAYSNKFQTPAAAVAASSAEVPSPSTVSTTNENNNDTNTLQSPVATPPPPEVKAIEDETGNSKEFEAILRSAHSGRSKPSSADRSNRTNATAPRVRTNGSVTSRWNPGGTSTTTTTPRAASTAHDQSPFLSSNTTDKPAWARDTKPASQPSKPAWAKDTTAASSTTSPRSEVPRKSLVSRWNESNGGSPVGSPFWKTNQSAKREETSRELPLNVTPQQQQPPQHEESVSSLKQEEESSPSSVVRSRVSDIKSKFQKTPVVNSALRQRNLRPLSPRPMSPRPMSPKPMSPKPMSPKPILQSPTSPVDVDITIEAADAPISPEPRTGWESPRTRRLRALAAAAAANDPPNDIKTDPPRGNSNNKKYGNRIADIYQAKIDQSHEQQEEEQDPNQEESTEDLESSVHQTVDDRVTIETPQKLSVSAMKAKLWGSEEKLIVPLRSPPSAYKPPPPMDSPKLVAPTRNKFAQGGFKSPPQQQKPTLRTVPSPQPDPVTPPRVRRDLLQEETSPDLIVEDRAPSADTNAGIPVAKDTAAQQQQQQEQQLPAVTTSRQLGSEPAAKTPPKNSWRGRTFKKSVGAALESRIQAIWGNGGTEKASADVGSPQTVLPPVSSEATVRSVQDTSKNGKDVHLAELNTKSNHQRLPSVGDFQVGDTTKANTRGRVDLDTSANRNSVHHRDVSPTNRPTNIPQWRSFDKGDAPLSPLRTDPPSRIPSYSPQHVDSSFTEAIDAPPSEGPTDADRAVTPIMPFGDDQPASPVLSPRSKESHPWNQDASRFSPAMWRQNKDQEPAFDFQMTSTERDQSFEEKKNTEEELLPNVSHHSLTQMAADSFLVVDHNQALEALTSSRGISEDSSTDKIEVKGYRTDSDEEQSPPVRPRADSGAGGSAIFGYPVSFGSSGGVTEEVEVSVAERAKAVATWSGGLGATPPRPSRQVNTSNYDDFSNRRSPEQNPLSESISQGMNPSVSKRGFCLDEWQQVRSDNGSQDFPGDPWTPAGMESFTDHDWPLMKEDQFALEDTFNAGNSVSMDKFDSPPPQNSSKSASAKHSEQSSRTGDVAPKSLFVLDQPHIDSERKNLRSWRMRKGKTSPPNESATKSERQAFPELTPFDPFSDAFGAKVDFTESTEPTDNTDFFAQDSDPFFGDLAPITETKSYPSSKTRKKISTQAKPFLPPVLTTNSSGDRKSPTPSFSELAPPSGSMEEVWSYEVGLTPTGSNERSSKSKSTESERNMTAESTVMYDADISTALNESAAEI